jgi:glycosyltransferase involved in cell wall biosynthesis
MDPNLDGAETRRRVGVADGVPLVVLVAGIRPVKGVREAIALLKQARESADSQHPASRLRLLLVGPVIDPVYGEAVLAEARRLGWVEHIESVAFEAMPEVYAAADLVLNTSLSEGMSNALLEAMACGRPVLAASIPANLELVGDGRSGLAYRTADEFVAGVHRVLSDRDFARSLGEAARATATTKHGPTAERDALLAAIAEALVNQPSN